MRTYKITVNGRTYEVSVEESAGVTAPVAEAVSANPAPAPSPAPAPTPAPAPAPTPAPAPAVETKPTAPAGDQLTGEVMKAPMPGTILSVKVKVGDQVKKGTVLCILEAMKMENEIQSGRDGVITGISVSAGQSVNAGDPMLSMD